MPSEPPPPESARWPSIWWFAFGYFAAYAPYSALTKALSKGAIPGMAKPLDGFVLLPVTVASSTVGMMVFLTALGWWRYATQRSIGGYRVPSPRLITLVSGACTSTIVMTTTLAYTFEGISIVFAMLLMRGGVLIIAPIVDALARRRVRWFSWVALVLSMCALVAAFLEKSGFDISAPAAIDIGLYLGAYFVRLRLMSSSAKSEDKNANVRFFVEEQMVATPLSLLVLGGWALAGGVTGDVIASGFTSLWSDPFIGYVILVGLLSQGTGVFGGLVLLDKRENTFCVPVNRASSVLAGVVASYGMVVLLGAKAPSGFELIGVALIIAAILLLSIVPIVERRRARAPQ